MADPRARRGNGADGVSGVDPGSEEARRRRKALSGVGADGARSRRYAVACVVPLLMLGALYLTAPDLAVSYLAFIGVLIALPFVLAVVVGLASEGDIVPNPFVAYPVASLVTATLVFLAVSIAAPGLLGAVGGMAVGVVVGVVVAVLLLLVGLWLLATLFG